MPKLQVDVPDAGKKALHIECSEPVLIGRAPDASRLDGESRLERVRTFAIASPSVSGNHLLGWQDDGELCLCDVGSRNGTWVR